jgi:acyl-CoA thioesterase
MYRRVRERLTRIVGRQEIGGPEKEEHPMPDAPQPPGGPAAAMFEADLASRSIGMELVEAGAGAATVRMTIGPAMVNGHAIAHGGYVFLLADTAFACACNSKGPVTVAAGADITFVAPARQGDVLVAIARERVSYGRSGIYDVTVRRGEDIVAEFRGRSRSIG